LVILETPYAGDVEKNIAYARACLRDCLLRGEAPIASHLLYTQPGVLDDGVPDERQRGIDAGLAWRRVADASVVYTDLGVSRGMEYGIAAARSAGLAVEMRGLQAFCIKPWSDRTQLTPCRIQRRRTKGWRLPGNTIVVDRSTPFGNPFPVTKGTSRSMGVTTPVWIIGTWEGPAMWFRDTKEEAMTLSVDAYRAWVAQPPQANIRERARLALRGKNLACWCPPSSPCHADVLLEIANG